MWNLLLPIAGQLVGGLLGRSASRGDRRRAQQRADQQWQMAMRSADIGDEVLGIGRDMYGRWQNQYAPVESEFLARALQGFRPDYAAITSDVNSAYDAARGTALRALSRRGVSPWDGAYGGTAWDNSAGRALALVGARNRARQQNQRDNFNALGQAMNAGNALLGNAVNTMGGAASFYAPAQNVAGQQSQQYARSAAGTAGAVSNVVGGVFNALGRWPRKPGGGG